MTRPSFRYHLLRIGLAGWLSLLVCLPAFAAATAEQTRIKAALANFDWTPVDIPRIDAPNIRVDGQLSEDAWSHAAEIEIAWQNRPIGGLPAKVRTTALVMEDGRTLYVGYRAYDPDPDQIRASLRPRDRLFADDYVGFGIDTEGDGAR
ncbi:MAG: hypothetical protein AAF525_07500, partial [Pseudomonadota bacterium]